jgi:hypothetical protein
MSGLEVMIVVTPALMIFSFIAGIFWDGFWQAVQRRRGKARPVRVAFGSPVEIEVRAGEVGYTLVLTELRSEFRGPTQAVFTDVASFTERHRV